MRIWKLPSGRCIERCAGLSVPKQRDRRFISNPLFVAQAFARGRTCSIETLGIGVGTTSCQYGQKLYSPRIAGSGLDLNLSVLAAAFAPPFSIESNLIPLSIRSGSSFERETRFSRHGSTSWLNYECCDYRLLVGSNNASMAVYFSHLDLKRIKKIENALKINSNVQGICVL